MKSPTGCRKSIYKIADWTTAPATSSAASVRHEIPILPNRAERRRQDRLKLSYKCKLERGHAGRCTP